MDTIAGFFQHNIIVVYFFYGLAFFSMGLLVWLESGRTSEFRIARAMGPLAGFGIIHGLHEWFEMFQLLGNSGITNIPGWLLSDTIRLGHLILSFLLLVIFGVRLVYSSGRGNGDEQVIVTVSAGGLFILWLFSVVSTFIVYGPCAGDCITNIDVLTRYILGIPGAVLASWALILEHRSFKARGMSTFGRDLRRAAFALFFYGVIGQLFPKYSVLFPANYVNADLFLNLFGIPIQLFRAAMATLMAVFAVRAFRAFELERQQRLALANEQRLAAQREALAIQQKARKETEELNRELQTAVQDLTLLFELSRDLNATLNRNALLQQAVTKIHNSLPRIAGGMIFLRDKPDKPVRLMAKAGYQNGTENDAIIHQHARDMGRYVVETGKPACCEDSQVNSLAHNLDEEEKEITVNGDTLGVPLMVQDEVAGSLVLSVQPQAPSFTRRDLSFISTVAGQLGIAIENATLYQEVQAREALRGELLHRVVSAQERERQRIARELHDGTGQALTALGLGIAAANESVRTNPELAARQLKELRTFSNQAMQDLREVISNLRPSVLDNLGLVAALQGQVQAFADRTGVDTELIVSGQRRRMPPEVETIIFRIAQEALTNVAKHAGATAVTTRLAFKDDTLQLTVMDNGKGFEPEEALSPDVKDRHAWGLLGMQERVALVRGSWNIQSQPGVGTTIQATFPLTNESDIGAPAPPDEGVSNG